MINSIKWEKLAIKWVLILVVCNFGVLVRSAPLSDLILHERKADFLEAEFEGLKWYENEIVLDKKGLEKGLGILISPTIPTTFPFNNAVPSWNCIAPINTGLRVELRAGKGEKWTDWFEVSQWGRDIPSKGYGLKKSWDGYVDADTLELYQEFDNLQYRLTLISQDNIQTPRLRRFAIVYADKTKLGMRNDTTPSSAWGKVIEVPYFAQLVEDPSIAGRICAPTSMTMVLNYYKYDLPTREIADLAYDSLNVIYGNWPYIAAVAGELGLKSYVTRFPDWRGVEEQIAAGHPVIISIRFAANQLMNSPIKSTAGHIIVVRGFTEDGQIICNDPAAYTKERGQVIYDREQLRRAWSNGVAIVTEPEIKSSLNLKLMAACVAAGVAVSLLLWLLLK